MLALCLCSSFVLFAVGAGTISYVKSICGHRGVLPPLTVKKYPPSWGMSFVLLHLPTPPWPPKAVNNFKFCSKTSKKGKFLASFGGQGGVLPLMIFSCPPRGQNPLPPLPWASDSPS